MLLSWRYDCKAKWRSNISFWKLPFELLCLIYYWYLNILATIAELTSAAFFSFIFSRKNIKWEECCYSKLETPDKFVSTQSWSHHKLSWNSVFSTHTVNSTIVNQDKECVWNQRLKMKVIIITLRRWGWRNGRFVKIDNYYSAASPKWYTCRAFVHLPHFYVVLILRHDVYLW